MVLRKGDIVCVGGERKKEQMEKFTDEIIGLFVEVLKEFRFKKRFVTRGTPFAKKMWRDGYNKAIDDIISYVEMLKTYERKSL